MKSYMESVTKTLVSNEKIKELVKKHFGNSVSLVSAEIIPEGFFNACYRLELKDCEHDKLILKTGVETGKYVLTYEQGLMQTEIDVNKLMEKNGIPVPRIFATDFSRTDIDCDYFFMEYLRGVPWGSIHNTDSITSDNTRTLHRELGRYTAMIHSIKGDYFGYIREDKFYRHQTWREAFRAMVDSLIQDGRRDKIELPYNEIYDTLESLWHLLDEIKEPSLVHYDMWAKNIMLMEKDGRYVIDGIIDLERSFYGDPVADFISTTTILGDFENDKDFITGYEEIKPFVFTQNDKIRLCMYGIYMGLLIGIEVYRYKDEDIDNILNMSRGIISHSLNKLRSF